MTASPSTTCGSLTVSIMVRRAMRRVRDWFRSRYGLREIIFPEKYRVDPRHNVVVTYSSSLALLYFAQARDIRRNKYGFS